MTPANWIDTYQKNATRIKKYPESNQNLLYLLCKLTEETGEVSKEIVREFEGNTSTEDLTSELGDVLWCVAAIAEQKGILLSDIIEQNVYKLQKRNLI